MSIFQTRRAFMLVAFLFGVSTTAISFPASSLADEAKPVRQIREFRGETMGTTYMVKVAGVPQIDDDALRFGIDGELRAVNDQMSTYLKSSEISTFNQSESTDWFPVSRDFAFVVKLAQEIAENTDGAFDITVGPLVNAWSFGPGERTQKVPEQSVLDELKQQVGYQKLAVRLEPPAIKKSIPNLSIDLSAIAKGHGVDRVVSRLAKQGAADVFVEIGGEVRVEGDKPGGPWRVGVQLPDAVSDQVMVAHPMIANDPAGTSMATSGDYRNFFAVDGKRYSHTIDPRSAKPVTHSLASVTVIAPTCAEADGWATALNVLGAKAGHQLAKEQELSTLLISRGSDTDFKLAGTGVLQQYAEGGRTPVAEASFMQQIAPVAIMTFGVFSILLFAMAIGVVFGRKSISGSCGGLANKENADGSSSCSLCSSPSDACKELREQMAAGRKSEG